MGGSYGPTIVYGEIQYLSPSGISKYDPDQPGGCPLKGYLHYVRGLKEPFTQANKIGTNVHKELEHHLRTGEMSLGSVALTAKQYIPQHRERLLIEHKIEPDALKVSGIRAVGEIDVLDPGWEGELYTVNEDGELATEYATVEVLDWKSTSNVAKWSKPADTLMGTIQMPLYGKYGLTRDPAAEFVRLSHVYMQTRGAPCSTKETLRVSRDEIDKRWTGIEKLVDTIKDYAKETDHNKIPKNRNACGAWGRRCMHANTFCAKGLTESIDEIFGITVATKIRKGDTKMDLEQELATLEGDAAAAGVLGAKPSTVTVPDTFLKDWADIISCEMGYPPLNAEAAAVFQTATGVPVTNRPLEGDGSYGTLQPIDVATVGVLANNLRESGTVKAEAPEVAAEPEPPKPEPEAPKPEIKMSLKQPEVQPTPVEGECAELIAARECLDKGSFSSMRKDAMAKAIGALANMAPAPQASEQGYDAGYRDGLLEGKIQADAEHEAGDVGTVLGGITLYIDALPSEPFDRLDTYTRKVCQILEEQTGAKDIRCSDNDKLSYGKWKGALAACVRAIPPEDGVYVIDTRGNEINEVIAATLTESVARYSRGL